MTWTTIKRNDTNNNKTQNQTITSIPQMKRLNDEHKPRTNTKINYDYYAER